MSVHFAKVPVVVSSLVPRGPAQSSVTYIYTYHVPPLFIQLCLHALCMASGGWPGNRASICPYQAGLVWLVARDSYGVKFHVFLLTPTTTMLLLPALRVHHLKCLAI